MSKNAFYFFMLDWAKQKRRCGLSVPDNMKEISTLCSDDWKVIYTRIFYMSMYSYSSINQFDNLNEYAMLFE